MTKEARRKMQMVEPGPQSKFDEDHQIHNKDLDSQEFPKNIFVRTMTLAEFHSRYANNNIFHFDQDFDIPGRFRVYKKWYDLYADGLVPNSWIDLDNHGRIDTIINCLKELEQENQSSKTTLRWPEEIITALVFHPNEKVLEMIAQIFRLNIYQLAILFFRTEPNPLGFGSVNAITLLNVMNAQIQLGNHKKELEQAIHYTEQNMLEDSYLNRYLNYFLAYLREKFNNVVFEKNQNITIVDKIKKTEVHDKVPNFLYDIFVGNPSKELLLIYEDGVLSYDDEIFRRLTNEFNAERDSLDEKTKTEKYKYIFWLWRFAGILPKSWLNKSKMVSDVFDLLNSGFVFPSILVEAILTAPIEEFKVLRKSS